MAGIYSLNLEIRLQATDHFTVWALPSQGDPGTEDVQTTAFGISGELELDEFSRATGAEVSGRFRLRTGALENSGVETRASN